MVQQMSEAVLIILVELACGQSVKTSVEKKRAKYDQFYSHKCVLRTPQQCILQLLLVHYNHADKERIILRASVFSPFAQSRHIVCA